MFFVLLVLAAVGHAVLWVALVNRLHAVGINRLLIHALTGVCGLAVAGIPLAIGYGVYRGAVMFSAEAGWPGTLAGSYLVACAVVGILSAGQRWRVCCHAERRGVVHSNHTVRVQAAGGVAVLAAPGIPAWLARLPFNQVHQIHVHEKRVVVPALPADHDGLRIVHLSDLHMSGRITKAYFQQVVEHANACEPDIIAVTGDLLERDKCIEWIPDTLGRLTAKGGVFYVLGNHDRHVNTNRLHTALAAMGWEYLGGRWREVIVRGLPLVLAGNELPWYGPAADMDTCPRRGANGLPLRVVLSHSPDQFRWAQQHDVDLILAGHNHGGQICAPWIGPILAPSRYGVRYAAGAFRAGNTVLHVSRGTASLTPIRVNCPPEIAVLILESGR